MSIDTSKIFIRCIHMKTQKEKLTQKQNDKKLNLYIDSYDKVKLIRTICYLQMNQSRLLDGQGPCSCFQHGKSPRGDPPRLQWNLGSVRPRMIPKMCSSLYNNCNGRIQKCG